MDYIYVTNNEKLYEFLNANTDKEVKLMEITLFESAWADSFAKETGQRYVFFMYEGKPRANENKSFLAQNNILARYYSSSTEVFDPETDSYTYNFTVEEYIEYLKPRISLIEKNLDEADDNAFKIGYRLVCGNCGHIMGYKDKYCFKCGTRRGRGVFDPRDRVDHSLDILYGSPTICRTKCPKCGKIWRVDDFTFSNGDTYCVDCGVKGEVVRRKELNFGEEVDDIDAWLDKD